MRSIFDFFSRHRAVFVFLLLAVVSCIQLFRGNPYQQAVFMTSAGKLTSSVYKASDAVTGYFHLRSVNEELNSRIADLEQENLALRAGLSRANEQLFGYGEVPVPALESYRFIVGRVINNSLARPRNFLTINRGLADGVCADMGVVDQNGVVGIVNVVGEHASRVISVLNADLRLSCKLKGSDAFGSLSWDGRSPRHAILEELPRHVPFEVGDTIVTSGHSVVFPEGIPVGTVVERMSDADDNFYSLKILLAADFSTLSTIRVIENYMKDEIEAVETGASTQNKK